MAIFWKSCTAMITPVPSPIGLLLTHHVRFQASAAVRPKASPPFDPLVPSDLHHYSTRRTRHQNRPPDRCWASPTDGSPGVVGHNPRPRDPLWTKRSSSWWTRCGCTVWVSGTEWHKGNRNEKVEFSLQDLVFIQIRGNFKWLLRTYTASKVVNGAGHLVSVWGGVPSTSTPTRD